MTNPSGDQAGGLTEVRYEHTPSFPAILEQLGITLLVSTYQAGKLLVLGSKGGSLAVSFQDFDRVMGVAVHPLRIAVGSRRAIWFLQEARDIAPRLEPTGAHDTCYLARRCHMTGEIHVHDLAFSGEELWLVNTLFSCLCTLDENFSFVPRWKPPFIKALAAEDRCHLNGLALENGRPRYATAMAECDTPGGWRPTKATSGCLLEVPSGEAVVRNLCMPHSPRVHEGRLWVLDSGHGRLSLVDRSRGRAEPVTHLPGYTRGLSLCGPYAFVGLSRIRETSVFGGIPIAADRERLRCGVAVVDVRSGEMAGGFVFHSGVSELFAVEVLPGRRHPALFGPEEGEKDQTIWYVPGTPEGPDGSGR